MNRECGRGWEVGRLVRASQLVVSILFANSAGHRTFWWGQKRAVKFVPPTP